DSYGRQGMEWSTAELWRSFNRYAALEEKMAVVEEGQLKGAFRGFHDRETVFEFYGGGKWRQNEYKYNYYYAYMPYAKVVDDGGGYQLEAEGMNDTVEVVRVR
ncbi:MAG TPA: hypothetical protein VF944_03345, partial [Candidatus Bathyarchaeia archaeon]